jgi:hypothetical protein
MRFRFFFTFYFDVFFRRGEDRKIKLGWGSVFGGCLCKCEIFFMQFS